MISGKQDAIRALLAGNLDSLFQQTLTNTLASVLELDCPATDDSLAPPSPATLLRCIAVCPSKNKSTDDILSPLCNDNAIITKPLCTNLLSEANVPASQPSHEDKERHRDTTGCRSKYEDIAVLAHVLSNSGHDDTEDGQVDRVEDHNPAGHLALLCYRVGDQVQAIDAVIF